MKYLTVSEIARPLGVRPKDISDLFYQRELSDDACPVVGGRRLIHPDYVPSIVAALKKKGCLKEATAEDRQSTEPINPANRTPGAEPSAVVLPAATQSITQD